MALFVETAITGHPPVFGGGPECRFWGGVQKTINLTGTTGIKKNDVFCMHKFDPKKTHFQLDDQNFDVLINVCFRAAALENG
jgi:hypothetical protein